MVYLFDTQLPSERNTRLPFLAYKGLFLYLVTMFEELNSVIIFHTLNSYPETMFKEFVRNLVTIFKELVGNPITMFQDLLVTRLPCLVNSLVKLFYCLSM